MLKTTSHNLKLFFKMGRDNKSEFKQVETNLNFNFEYLTKGTRCRQSQHDRGLLQTTIFRTYDDVIW